ncbi:MAG: hypothetical protein ACM3NT_04025, partial [Methylocystaceae bacterium]
VALFPTREDVVFCPDKLKEMKNEFASYLPEYSKWQSIIQVYDLAKLGKELWLDADIKNHKTACFFADIENFPADKGD